MDKSKVKELIMKAVSESGAGPASEEQHEEIAKVLEAAFVEGAPAYKAMGIDDAGMEMIYNHAYNLYNSGNFTNARDLFLALAYLDQDSWKYQMGMAASLHKLGDYEGAVQAYGSAAMNDEKDPLSLYHMSDCYEKQNDIGSALITLGRAIGRIDPATPKYKDLKEQMLLHRRSLCMEVGINADDLEEIEKKLKSGG